jgi:membrane-associated progesterone receptor component
MSDTTEQPKKERFAPKEPVTLSPPKDDPITREHLAKCDGRLLDPSQLGDVTDRPS